jgi:hypothetical protein
MLQTPAWYDFVNGQLNRMASNGSLYLVTGADKALSWGVASYSNTSGETGISLQLTVADNTNVPATRHYAWERSGQVAARAGPRRPARYENQCVFIRGFKLALRTNPLTTALMGPVKLFHTMNSDPSDILQKGHDIPGAPKSSSFGAWLGRQDNGGSSSGGSQRPLDIGSACSPDVTIELFPEVSEVRSS